MRETKAGRVLKMNCALSAYGFDFLEAITLRRIAQRLHTWSERECGTDWGCIERDESTGIPFRTWDWPGNKGPRGRMQIKDDEAVQLARLKKLMTTHDSCIAYIQGDPRGAPLYIVRKSDVRDGESVDEIYTRGIAVYTEG